MRDFIDRQVRFFGIAGEDLEFSLTKLTELAKRIRDGQGTDDLLPTIEELEARERDLRQLINQKFEWSVKLKKGEVELPPPHFLKRM